MLNFQNNAYFHRFIVQKKIKIQKSKFRSLFPNLTKIFDPWTQKFLVWNKNQDLGISTLVCFTFYRQKMVLGQNLRPSGLKTKIGKAMSIRYSQKPIGRMRTPFDTSKTSKSQGSNTSLILAKFQKSWRRNIPVDIHNPNFKRKTKVRKNLKFQKSWGGDIPSIPAKQNFWRKSREATLSRYLHPTSRGSDIPSILATEWARRRHSIDTCNTIQQGGDS